MSEPARPRGAELRPPRCSQHPAMSAMMFCPDRRKLLPLVGTIRNEPTLCGARKRLRLGCGAEAVGRTPLSVPGANISVRLTVRLRFEVAE